MAAQPDSFGIGFEDKIAYVPAAGIGLFLGELDRAAGKLRLGDALLLRTASAGAPIERPGGFLHALIHAGGVAGEDLFHWTKAVNELLSIQRGRLTHSLDRTAEGVPLTFEMDDGQMN